MSSFLTSDRHGYNAKFSPFDENQLVVATSQLYGLAGGGTLYLLEQFNDEINEICQFEWTDGLFDVVWSPHTANIVATASGDGSIQLWDLERPGKKAKPIHCLQEHKNEVYSLDWGELWNQHQLLSASWDGSIKIWDSTRTNSLSTFLGHSDLIYCSKFSPLIPNLFSSVSTDGTLNLWNSLDFSGKPLMAIQTHSGEVLTCDWSKFDRNILITGASDGLIRGWDLRNLRDPVFELFGSDYAVRRVAFSPYSSTIIASANYDFTTRIWDFMGKVECLEIIEQHSEFVYGLDWSLHTSNQLADCGWDSFVNVFIPDSLKDK